MKGEVLLAGYSEDKMYCALEIEIDLLHWGLF